MSKQDDTEAARPNQFEEVVADVVQSYKKESFDKFTERARKVLSLARDEARRFDHNYIGTEHLLLGLVAEGEGVAAKTLDNLGVELDRVREAVERIIGRGDRKIVGEIGLTPRAKKVIELSIDEARRLRHRYIGTEHLLLGLIREGEGIAAGVLIDFDLTLDQIRAQVIQILGGAAPGPKNNVVMCRLDDRTLDSLDTLIEAGVRSTRADAAAWLIQAGIQANAALFESVSATVEEIRRLRGVAQDLARLAAEGNAPAAPSPEGAKPPDIPSA